MYLAFLSLQSDYFFRGQVRMGWGWENPNHAAAVVAGFAPFLWALTHRTLNQGSRAWVLAGLFAAEGLILYMLCSTYSRSGVLAAGAALTLFSILQMRRLGFSKVLAGVTAGRLGALTLLCIGLGTGARFGTIATGDQSAGHRLQVWSGALRLIEVQPWVGWGKGQSGMAFCQWFQDPSETYMVGGMVNSYLHVAVEFGLPALCLLLAGLGTLLKIAISGSGKKFPAGGALLFSACAASLTAFSISNFFNTLWNQPGVVPFQVVVCLLIGVLYYKELLCRSFLSHFLPMASGAMVGIALLFSAAVLAVSHDKWRLRLAPDGLVSLTRQEGPDLRPQVLFLPDTATLGAYYGREIRGMIELHARDVSSYCICPPRTRCPDGNGTTTVLFGCRLPDMPDTFTATHLILVAPTGRPAPRGFPVNGGNSELFLPELDELGWSGEWIQFSKDNRINLRRLEGCGQNVTKSWPSPVGGLLSRPL